MLMNPYANGHYKNSFNVAQQEYEWEQQEASHQAQSYEFEGDDGAAVVSDIQQAAQTSIPVAKRLAARIARRLASGAKRPVAKRQINAVLRRGEATTATMEAQLFGHHEFEMELGNSEQAYEAALAEILAAEASHSQSEYEAAAFLGAALPSIVENMGGRNTLRSVMPTLVQANSQLVRELHQNGPNGRRLLRVVPSIMRRTVATLNAAHEMGHLITINLVLPVMATQVARVLTDPRKVTRGIVRNALIQRRTAH
jgi:hypothetical protein